MTIWVPVHLTTWKRLCNDKYCRSWLNYSLRVVWSVWSIYHIWPNYRTMGLGFSKLLGKLMVKYVSTYTKGTLKKLSAKDLSNDAYGMFLCCCFFFSDCLFKSICCGYSFELHQQVDAIQMGPKKICIYKEENKKYTGCNLWSTELLDCAHVCGN